MKHEKIRRHSDTQPNGQHLWTALVGLTLAWVGFQSGGGSPRMVEPTTAFAPTSQAQPGQSAAEPAVAALEPRTVPTSVATTLTSAPLSHSPSRLHARAPGSLR